MMRRLLALPVLVALCGCPFLDQGVEAPAPYELTTFKVETSGVFVYSDAGTSTPLDVTADCLQGYPSQADVPLERRGTKSCPYIIPSGEVRIRLHATALDKNNKTITHLLNPVSFRVIPGDLSNDQYARWGTLTDGEIDTEVRVVHPYSEVRVWVEDAPPKKVYTLGAEPDPTQLPDESTLKRTYATGASPIIYFGNQTLQTLQYPGVLDNTSSPFVGEFVVVGKGPNTGEKLTQSCANDPARNGKDALMVVTGLDPSGFYVSDISACRLKELRADALGNTVRTANWEPPEPCLMADGTENTDGGEGHCDVGQQLCHSRADCDGYMPGTFAGMFVYNYNFPDGLDQGDLLFTLSGSVQEFTSTTQLTFPAWLTAERVRQLPQDQWNKWLQYAKPYDLGGRTCNEDNVLTPYLTDVLCGHNRRSLKMESLESSLVRARHIQFPKVFKNCDQNGDGTVPFFCENPPNNTWGSCGGVETALEASERQCNQDCTLGVGPYAGTICAEESNFVGFGQFPVQMQSPGPAELGFDPQLPARYLTKAVPGGPADGGAGASTKLLLGENYAVSVRCDQPVYAVAGDDLVTAQTTDPVLPPNTRADFTFVNGQTGVAFRAVNAAASCGISINARTRINLVTKDAVPELVPNCHEDDTDTDAATQCKALHAAEFDVVGHLKQIQAARPRWAIIPRDPDDLCCYPGPGLECPRPIKPCN